MKRTSIAGRRRGVAASTLGPVLLFFLSCGASAANAQQMRDLTVEFQSPSLIINGITTTPSGRKFVVIQPLTAKQPQVAEITTGEPIAYPNAAWNGRKPSEDGSIRFVGVNSLRVGPDGMLWVVDRGAPGIGKALVPGGPKLIRIDLANNKVTRIYDLSTVVQGKSFVDDVRFNGKHAYLTDAGRPAIIVLDLETGNARRILENHPSTVAHRPLTAEGKQLRDSEGKPIIIHADQLEVSADGKWLFYQPCTGPMSRIETRYLDDPTLTPDALDRNVQSFADTPSTGGTAIDANGTIYSSDTNRSRILKIAEDGSISTLIADPRLAWVDAMWIDDSGKLWMPAAQLNRVAGLNDSVDAVYWPVTVYSIEIGEKPVRR